MEVNKKLKKYLEENGIKQSFLEEKTGISQEKISNMMTGKRKITADELSKICQALKVSADLFLR